MNPAQPDFAQGMTLRRKSIIGLISLMVTLVLLNLATFELLRGHISSLSSMIDVSVIMDDLKDLTGKESEGLPADIEEYSLHPNAKKKTEIETDLAAIDQRLALLEHETLDDKIRTELGLVANMLKGYHESFNTVLQQISSGAAISDINARVGQIKGNSALISEAINQLISDELDYDRIAKVQLARKADASGFLLLSGSVIASVLAFFLFYVYLMKENILRPLENMRHTMSLIAHDASDIRLRIKLQQHDEIGVLGEYFNRMADTIQKYKEHLEEQVQTRTAQLTETQARLVESGKLSALGEMAGGIAHEVNNPLAVIALNCSQLERLLENSQHGTLNFDAANKFVRNIETTTNRIAKIVKALKTYSRNTEGDPYQKTLLKTVIDDTLALCSEKFKSFGIDLRISCEPPDLMLECRPTEISQVFLNLLNNAFDEVAHRPSGWVTLHAFQNQDYAEVHVTDSGNGIPPDLVQKIFLPFFTTKDIGKGTGLGLSISKGLIEAHGGTITTDPTCPNTRFVIRLPLIHSKR